MPETMDERKRKRGRMTKEISELLRLKLIQIAESFDKWLENTAKEQNMDKNQIQELIKQLLQ